MNLNAQRKNALRDGRVHDEGGIDRQECGEQQAIQKRFVVGDD
jgi:hypothetical protein